MTVDGPFHLAILVQADDLTRSRRRITLSSSLQRGQTAVLFLHRLIPEDAPPRPLCFDRVRSLHLCSLFAALARKTRLTPLPLLTAAHSAFARFSRLSAPWEILLVNTDWRTTIRPHAPRFSVRSSHSERFLFQLVRPRPRPRGLALQSKRGSQCQQIHFRGHPPRATPLCSCQPGLPSQPSGTFFPVDDVPRVYPVPEVQAMRLSQMETRP